MEINIQGNIMEVSDIFDDLPPFMKKADVIFTDIPYNQSLLTNYSNRPNVNISDKNTVIFGDFLLTLKARIKEISPRVCFLEVGKENLYEVLSLMKSLYKHTTFYNSHYYKNVKNKCYIVVGSNKKSNTKYPIDDLDEANIIDYVCENVEFDYIGDLCMGKGLVGRCALKHGKKFVGTELNKERLDFLVKYTEKFYD